MLIRFDTSKQLERAARLIKYRAHGVFSPVQFIPLHNSKKKTAPISTSLYGHICDKFPCAACEREMEVKRGIDSGPAYVVRLHNFYRILSVRYDFGTASSKAGE